VGCGDAAPSVGDGIAWRVEKPVSDQSARDEYLLLRTGKIVWSGSPDASFSSRIWSAPKPGLNKNIPLISWHKEPVHTGIADISR